MFRSRKREDLARADMAGADMAGANMAGARSHQARAASVRATGEISGSLFLRVYGSPVRPTASSAICGPSQERHTAYPHKPQPSTATWAPLASSAIGETCQKSHAATQPNCEATATAPPVLTASSTISESCHESHISYPCKP